MEGNPLPRLASRDKNVHKGCVDMRFAADGKFTLLLSACLKSRDPPPRSNSTTGKAYSGQNCEVFSSPLELLTGSFPLEFRTNCGKTRC